MKNLVIISLLSCFAALPAQAQSTSDFYKDLLTEGDAYVVQEIPSQDGRAKVEDTDKAAADAKAEARKLLQQRPQTLRKQNFPKLRQRASKAQLPTPERSQAAPFGLVWGSSITDTRNQGIGLQSIGEKDYVNNFSATKLPKMIDDFSRVDVTFGEDNKLWRIIAYGKLIKDEADASKVMRLYKIYNDLLTKKYGHAEEHFTPAMINVEKKDSRGRPTTVQETAPLGNPDFLKQLQSGEAELYSTYYNEDVGAALAVNVDGDGQSYIVIDYKNLRLMRAEENKTLDAL